MSGSGRKTLLEVREWSEGPHGGSIADGKPAHRSGSGREALPEVW